MRAGRYEIVRRPGCAFPLARNRYGRAFLFACMLYPTAVRRSNALVFQGKRFCYGPNVTRIQVDFTGPIPAELFERPAESPLEK